MSRFNVISVMVLTAIVLLVSTDTSNAALLAEIGTNVAEFNPSPPTINSVRYGFIVSSSAPPAVFGEWITQYTAADVGMTFDAPPDLVESFARALARPSAGVTISVQSISNSKTLDQLQSGYWAECCEIVTFRKFVPDITKIPTNRITRTIDSFRFERFGDNATIGGGQTIRIYGVPEPATWMLFLCGVTVVSARPHETHQ
jgi:hypothetical protein